MRTFHDPEINRISTGCQRADGNGASGLAETGDVLAALADTDLTHRMQGDYQGAFARLKDDTNAVADKL